MRAPFLLFLSSLLATAHLAAAQVAIPEVHGVCQRSVSICDDLGRGDYQSAVGLLQSELSQHPDDALIKEYLEFAKQLLQAQIRARNNDLQARIDLELRESVLTMRLQQEAQAFGRQERIEQEMREFVLDRERRPAECKSTATPSCNVYDRCFERICSCESTPDRYFISFGKKYCERFLGSSLFSQAGQRWRNRVLVCLQEKIVPYLPLTSSQCNCRELKEIAIRAHVGCYTQSDASICDLGADDWRKIFNIIDTNDIQSREMMSVGRICLGRQSLEASVRSIVQRLVERLVELDH